MGLTRRSVVGGGWRRRRRYYALQIDAHMYFVKDWDLKIIEQFEATQNDFAILSTYPANSFGSIDDEGHLLHPCVALHCVCGSCC